MLANCTAKIACQVESAACRELRTYIRTGAHVSQELDTAWCDMLLTIRVDKKNEVVSSTKVRNSFPEISTLPPVARFKFQNDGTHVPK